MNVLELRNTIYGIVRDTYAKDSPSYIMVSLRPTQDAQGSMAVDVTNHIIGYIALAQLFPDDQDDSLYHQIKLVLWNTWSGGGVAERTAAKICDALGLEKE